MSCGGEGEKESGGPVTWTCTTCLGTGFMAISLLAQFDLTKYPFYDQDWREAGLRNVSLRGATFESCNFTDAFFAGADLTNTTFESCQFAGANPETAASLEGAVLRDGTFCGATCRLCGSRGDRGGSG
jgi:uncharacterized protein YjbI with pentapeptide repeats